ncbi:MAG: hypothetical protein ACJA0B_000784 [Alcanivorax borkumensis]|jgi:hypothetical protein
MKPYAGPMTLGVANNDVFISLSLLGRFKQTRWWSTNVKASL